MAETRVASLTLRPPRVALLFRGDVQWREWALLAIRAVSAHWGGRGYVLVPFGEGGSIDPTVLSHVVEYDPDYIAIMRNPLSAWLELRPDLISLPDGTTVDGLAATSGDTDVHDPDERVAARVLTESCSPLRYASRREGLGTLQHISMAPPVDSSAFSVAPPPGVDVGATLAASAKWTGDLALWAAALTGLPLDLAPRPQPSDEELLRWFLQQRNPPEELSRVEGKGTPEDLERLATWFEASSPDVGKYQNGFAPDPVAVVLGDTVNDFALALVLERMLAVVMWLPEQVLQAHFDKGWRAPSDLEALIERNTIGEDAPALSASLSADVLVAALNRLRKRSTTTIDGKLFESGSPTLVARSPAFAREAQTLLMSAHLGDSTPVPVLTDEDGTVALQIPVQSVLPLRPALNKFGSPTWLVDVTIDDNPMPAGRSLSPKWLAHESNFAQLRSSRAGITFHASSFGFISGGTVLSSRLARPRLTFLGLRRWIEAQASEEDVHTSVSSVGQNAELLARRLGGRTRLLDIVSSPLLPVLREFVPRNGDTSTSKAFPDGDGVLASRVRFLTRSAMERVTPQLAPDERRALVDTLIGSRLMRQGLILGCDECSTVAFYSIDELGFEFKCDRCDAMNPLAQDRWHREAEEPRWFYDLHPAFRDVMRTRSDVVLLAANHLRSSSRNYSDAPELDFKSSDVGNLFEIDLVAQVDSELVVLEAKSNGSLGSGAERLRAVRKRFEAARLLHADEVVFACTGSWSEETQSVAESVRMAEYPSIRLRWIEALP